jgi:HPt (histidine-containing phosphotransfer) domain-containing protein
MDREEKLVALRELDNLPEEIYDELLGDLASITRQQLTELQIACDESDVSTMRNLAHSIRGAASNLRFRPLLKAIEVVQQALHQGAGHEQIRAGMGGVEQVLDDLDQYLKLDSSCETQGLDPHDS